MGEKSFQEVVADALRSMEKEGASAKQLKVYRQTGFGAIRRHFSTVGQSGFSDVAIDAFVLQARTDFERGAISKGKWYLVRRGGELLKHFHKHGELGLPSCAKWGFVHDRLRIEPSVQEFADKDNIYALVWNTRLELERSDFSASTQRHYQNEGFDRILRYCAAKVKSAYSPELINEFLSQVKTECSYHKSAAGEFYTLRRAAGLLQEFYETGSLGSCHVQRFDIRDNLDAVDNPNMRELMELALQKMENDGTKPKALKRYRTTGFGGIVRYCEKIKQPQYFDENIDSFVRQIREKYESGHISADTCGLIRRGGEILKSFASTGEVKISNLRPWNPILKRPSQSVELDAPTPEQLAEADNLFALIWRVRQELFRKGLAPNSIRHYTCEGFSVILRNHISYGLERNSEPLSIELVAEKREQYKSGQTSRTAYQNLRKANSLLTEMYRTGKITLSHLPDWGLREPTLEFAGLLRHFCDDVNRTGVLASSTVRTVSSAIRGFFFDLESRGVTSFKHVTLLEISGGVTQTARRYSGGLHAALFSLRIFFKHLHTNGFTAQDLTLAIPEMTAKRKAFREGFTVDEIRRLLESPAKTDIGKRDYAIMLLASQTGLRACDVVNLKREDIDWRANEIRIVQRKTGKPISMPLEPESGNAVAEYLLHYRPVSDLPYIFLCHPGEKRPINNRSASSIAAKHLRRAKVVSVIPRRGFHSFRRSFGTRMLQNEIPLELLRQLLGHTRMDSLKPYLSVEEQGLKNCALGLVGGDKAGDKA